LRWAWRQRRIVAASVAGLLLIALSVTAAAFFATRDRNQPAARQEMALAYGKMADLLQDAGSTEDAISAQQKALSICQELVVAEPENPGHQKALALCQNNLGLLLAHRGNTGQAQELFEKAIARQRLLLEKSPPDMALAAD